MGGIDVNQGTYGGEPVPSISYQISGDLTVGVRDSVTTVFEPTIDERKVSSGIQSPEKAEEFILFARAILNILPEAERDAFAKDPLNFVSPTLSFRGLTPEKYEDVKSTGFFSLQSGQYGSRAVFLTNAPYQAFTYQQKGAIAVIPVRNFKTLDSHGLVQLGSDTYRTHTVNRLAALPFSLTTSERSSALYALDDDLDLIEPSHYNKGENTYVLRSPQPIEGVEVFLVWKDGKVVREQPRKSV